MKFVFDLDGTICYQGQPLSIAMVNCLNALVEEGHELVFASARPIRDLLPVLPVHLHSNPLVGGNGGFVHCNGQHLSASYLEPVVADRILDLIRQHEAEYLIDSDWHYSYSGNPEHPIRKNIDPHGLAQNMPIDSLGNMVKVVILQCLNAGQLRGELEKLPVVVYMHGNENIMDISPIGTDKWTGLQQLGMKSGEFVAFGNDANDVPMFRHAARSICIGDHSVLQSIATECVPCHEEEVIRKINAIAAELRDANGSATVQLMHEMQIE